MAGAESRDIVVSCCKNSVAELKVECEISHLDHTLSDVIDNYNRCSHRSIIVYFDRGRIDLRFSLEMEDINVPGVPI